MQAAFLGRHFAREGRVEAGGFTATSENISSRIKDCAEVQRCQHFVAAQTPDVAVGRQISALVNELPNKFMDKGGRAIGNL